MKIRRIGMFLGLWPCGLLLLVACSNDLNLTVLYGRTNGLKPDSAVRLHDQQIGTVTAVEVNPQGRVAVRLRVRSAYRHRVTDNCRFLLTRDGQYLDRSVVELHCPAQGGAPLPNGVEVEGSTALGLLMEQGRRSLRAWTNRFEAEVKRWEQTLEQLPVEAWMKQMEDRLDDWTRELEQAGEETRRYFKQEVLPTLEAMLRALQRRLSDQGRQEDMERLERKLEGLKRI